MMNKPIKVLFVCTGNICRSPTAEGVFKTLLEQQGLSDKISVDSAGTHSYHIGEKPDSRSIAAALRRGIDLSSQRARQVKASDFQLFDLIVAMDRGHLRDLTKACPSPQHQRLCLMMDFAPNLGRKDVPDPYYGGADGFELVLDMLEQAALGLLAHIKAESETLPASAQGVAD